MAMTLAPAVAPVTHGPTHHAEHKRKHSEAEGLGLLAIGGGAIGFGIWQLLHKPSTTPGSATPSITTSTIPGGTVGTAYQTNIVASGGAPPYAWALTGGSLPPGLSLTTTGLIVAGQPNSTMGMISGTPSAAGTYNFTLQATDQNGGIATATFTLPIVGGAQATCGLAPETLIVDPSGTIYVVQSGGIQPITSKAAFDACGYDAASVQSVTAAQIANCTILSPPNSGPPCAPAPMGAGYPGPNCLMGPGLLAQVAGSAAVWYADCGTGPGGSGCQKHFVPASVFYGCGWQHQRLYPVFQDILDATPQGADLTGCVPLYSCGGGGGGMAPAVTRRRRR
ncbi:MAG TPA: Ig domain-containing protein [Candidatus Nanopelagicaceae bacterium]|nr:Ig domain-containing protein [Candidatus Nanopelagicaceae bacterium]